MRHAGIEVGDTVVTRFSGADEEARYLVVGTVVLPFTSDTTSLGEGVFLTTDGAARLASGLPNEAAFVRFRTGIDRQAAVAQLRREFPNAELVEATKPATVLDFGRVTGLPLLGAGVVGVLAAATIAHVLVTSVRAHRRDLAILKTLGARGHQLRAAVAWQATIIVLVALLIGIPLGAMGGHWVWGAIAGTHGFTVEVTTPALTLAILAAGALVVANLIAGIPARSAARTHPATVMRSG